MRNKLVGVERPGPGTFIARGFLDDHIYSLEVVLEVEARELCITAIEGRWNRYTTPDCPRSLEFLPLAVGLRLDAADFAERVHKGVGRKACRHFADLILECCDAVSKAAQLADGAGAPLRQPPAEPALPAREPATGPAASAGPGHRPGPQKPAQSPLNLPPAPEGFFIDLHVHTSEASACASSPLAEIIEEAKRIGLHGICLTDHNHLWDPGETADLARRHDLIILRGNEITTAQGDMLVFGLEREVKEIITLAELCPLVAEAGGFIIAAHPFRGFLVVGGDELGQEVQRVQGRPMFRLVDALETLNSKVTSSENQFATRVAAALKMPAVGGSDAHQVSEVGVFATRFAVQIRDEGELIAALKSGDYRPVPFRKMQGIA